MIACSECDGSWGSIPGHGVGACCVDMVLERTRAELAAVTRERDEERAHKVEAREQAEFWRDSTYQAWEDGGIGVAQGTKTPLAWEPDDG